MPLPMQKYIELPLLYEIEQMGGSVRPRGVYDKIARHFPLITEQDKTETTQTGSNQWTNRVQFVRNDLKNKGELDGSVAGVWRITDKGKERLRREWPPREEPKYSTKLYVGRSRTDKGPPVPPPTPTPPSPTITPLTPLPTITASPTANENSMKQQLTERLKALTPRQFEHLVGEVLRALGIESVQVTGRSGDGGIDGNGVLPFFDMKVAFQAKRWQQAINGPQMRDFKGGVQGRYERGVFITTSSFTPGSREEAEVPGAVKIVLVDGEKLVDMMLEKGLGVRTEPVTAQRIDETFFDQLGG